MNITKEVKVGVLGIVSLVLLYFGFNFLKGSDVLSSKREYLTTFDDVLGLEVSNTVNYKGVVVGRVVKITPNYKEDNVNVLISVKRDVKVTDHTEIELADDGLIGGKLLNLIVRDGETVKPGSQIKSSVKHGLMESVAEKLEPALGGVDTLISNLNKILVEFEHTGSALNSLLADASQTTVGVNRLVASNSQSLNTISANTAILTSKLNSVVSDLDNQLKPILSNATSFTDSLKVVEIASTVESLNQTINELKLVIKDINEGEGTLGKLSSNDSLYNNLNYTAESLNNLLIDFKESPKRYVHFSIFGRKDKKK